MSSSSIANYIDNFCIEISLISSFKDIKSTLSRTGTVNRERNTLIPSCYLLHRQGKYYIMHFKQLKYIDTNLIYTTFDDYDRARLIKIAKMIEKFGMIIIINNPLTSKIDLDKIGITVVKSDDVITGKWTVKHKYNIGVKDVAK